MITTIWLIACGIAAIWVINKVSIHFAEQTEKEQRQALDWELDMEMEQGNQRRKEQALECEYTTVMGELDRIKKLGLD